LHSLCAQYNSLLESEKFQKELNEEYHDPVKSPLDAKARKKFKGHLFYPIDTTYCVEAEVIPMPGSSFFMMPTSSLIKKEYRIYANLKFTLHGHVFEIPVYQSKQLMATEKYKDYLFFPFTDLTNGTETYDAGRYIELSMPQQANTIILDFNKAYNPYCAYSNKYSCPVVPKENFINTEVRAGVRYSNKKKHK
jgi:hypothetical protein